MSPAPPVMIIDFIGELGDMVGRVWLPGWLGVGGCLKR